MEKAIPSQMTIGYPRFVGDEVILKVSGAIGTSTLDEFQRTVEPLLRPPWITLDLEDAVIHSKGLKKLLELQLRYPKCQIRLHNVSHAVREDLERLQGKNGKIKVTCKAEVA